MAGYEIPNLRLHNKPPLYHVQLAKLIGRDLKNPVLFLSVHEYITVPALEFHKITIMKSDDANHQNVPFALTGLIEYGTNAVNSITIIEKLTGTIRLYAVGAGFGFEETTSAFDSFIQILEGSALVTVDAKVTNVIVGQSIIIPAHSRRRIVGETPFKMLSTVIKSGYEDESVR